MSLLDPLSFFYILAPCPWMAPKREYLHSPRMRKPTHALLRIPVTLLFARWSSAQLLTCVPSRPPKRQASGATDQTFQPDSVQRVTIYILAGE